VSAAAHPDYEVVIGLETHVHMKTRTKLFCCCALAYGDPPNHHTCPTCLALPGALPVLNEQAVDFALKVADYFGCEIKSRSVFARKNYFYPDLPKGYQVSQYEAPYCSGGTVMIPSVESDQEILERIRLVRIHIEEDAGKLTHSDSGNFSVVDLNRSGTPLLEIVTEPDLRSSRQVESYLKTLQRALRYLDVSDVDLEHGHFRCDVNVSLRAHGSTEYGTRTELKNMNSFRFITEAIEAEIERQTEVLDAGGAVQQCTLRYDPKTRTTSVMRLKENADDYRYFPDPDLIPLEVDQGRIDRIRSQRKESFEKKWGRFVGKYHLVEGDAKALAATRQLGEYFEAVVRAYGGPEKAAASLVSKWLLRDVARLLKARGLRVGDPSMKLSPEALAKSIRMVQDGHTTTSAITGSVLGEVLDTGRDPEALVRERGLEAVSDTGALEEAVDAVLAENAAVVERIRAGETKLLNALMGQVMKRTQGKADPGAVREILARKVAE